MERDDKKAGQPLARYASWKRAGDIVYMSGVIAVDPAGQRRLEGAEQLLRRPAARRAQ